MNFKMLKKLLISASQDKLAHPASIGFVIDDACEEFSRNANDISHSFYQLPVSAKYSPSIISIQSIRVYLVDGLIPRIPIQVRVA